MNASGNVHFIRDRLTWQNYLLLGYFAHVQASLGPLMPFLKEELALNYTVAGFHFSAFALGMVLAGYLSDRAASRWGRWRVFWGGGAGMTASALAFVLGVTPVMTIVSAFAMGCAGTFLLVMIQSTLSDHHGAHRAVALTEANVIASMGAGLAPLMIGAFQRSSLGWRASLVLAVFAWGAMLIRFHGEPVPAARSVKSGSYSAGRGLPRLFWSYWLVLFLGVAVEWSVIFWGADFLENNAGISRATAATTMSLYFLAVIIGRLLGSRLARLMATDTLLLLFISITMAGFGMFWLSSSVILTLAGLFVAGLGIANVFPLTLSIASSVVESHQSDAASGRISLGAGLAILVAPQILGSLADQTGIRVAFGVVALLLVTAFGVIAWTNHMMRPAAQIGS